MKFISTCWFMFYKRNNNRMINNFTLTIKISRTSITSIDIQVEKKNLNPEDPVVMQSNFYSMIPDDYHD